MCETCVVLLNNSSCQVIAYQFIMKFLFLFCVLVYAFDFAYGSVAYALPSKKTGQLSSLVTIMSRFYTIKFQ